MPPIVPNAKNIKSFPTDAAFASWMKANHARADEIWVKVHKKDSGLPSITCAEALDVALCYGWIDGIRKSVDADRYAIRFTPRKPGSTWSRVNIRVAQELIAGGRMRAAGRRAFDARRADKSGTYAFEQLTTPELDAAAEAEFRRAPEAWRFFQAQPPGYRRTVTWWVVSAKRPETRARRLTAVIEDSAAGRRIGLLRR